MTIGAGITAVLDGRTPGRLGRFLLTFGRAPLFVYVLHLFVIHSLSVAFLLVDTGRLSRAYVTSQEWGFGIPGLLLLWLAIVAMLYPPTRWFAGVKARRRDLWWLRYL